MWVAHDCLQMFASLQGSNLGLHLHDHLFRGADGDFNVLSQSDGIAQEGDPLMQAFEESPPLLGL